MRVVFADTGYLVALLHPRDDLHARAVEVSKSLGPCRMVTSEMVLAELLNSLAGKGAQLREAAANAVDAVRTDPNVMVIPQTSIQFREALQRYRNRLDKMWGFTDCASFLIMEETRTTEALAHDLDFEQAGFRALLRENRSGGP